jgi:hypothetical protein
MLELTLKESLQNPGVSFTGLDIMLHKLEMLGG